MDFAVYYDSDDELGELCESFGKMRQILYHNKIELWNMVEDRKKLQASVAHDLRKPKAIISGYIDFLKVNIPKGNITEEKLLYILENLSDTSRRMELYTDSIRNINQPEELKVENKEYDLQKNVVGIVDDFRVLAKHHNLKLEIKNEIEECKAVFDKQCFCRILENIFANAFRYADTRIIITFKTEKNKFITMVCDDGQRFTRENLQNKDKVLFYTKMSDGHMGMGLTISRILSVKI